MKKRVKSRFHARQPAEGMKQGMEMERERSESQEVGEGKIGAM